MSNVSTAVLRDVLNFILDTEVSVNEKHISNKQLQSAAYPLEHSNLNVFFKNGG